MWIIKFAESFKNSGHLYRSAVQCLKWAFFDGGCAVGYWTRIEEQVWKPRLPVCMGVVSLGVVMLVVMFDRPYKDKDGSKVVAVNTSINKHLLNMKALSYNSLVYYIINLTGPIFIAFYFYFVFIGSVRRETSTRVQLCLPFLPSGSQVYLQTCSLEFKHHECVVQTSEFIYWMVICWAKLYTCTYQKIQSNIKFDIILSLD